MGWGMAKQKKTTSDYGNFQFRMDKADMKPLRKQIEEIATALNEKRDKEDWAIRGNDVILEALRVGLPLVKKNGIKG